ncbi:hypothetical protein [Benzoatithermus flavus]|uniref:Uncharacterized protein n=1 Tax=Benzoatithermus flavus TaxID=3108223 RepID=A0ABU8XS34_9PROT
MLSADETELGERDLVLDFAEGDRLAIEALSLDSGLAFIGTARFTDDEQVRVAHAGGNTIVQVNLDDDLAPDTAIELVGIHRLTEADFIF